MRNPDPATPEGDVALQFKLPAALDQRLLAMRARLAERAGVPAAKLPKAEVARQALDRGLRAMEADLALPEGGGSGAERVVQSRTVAIPEPPGAYAGTLVRYTDERGVAKAIGRKWLLEHNGITDTGQSEASLEPLARVYPRTPHASDGTPDHSCPDCGEHHRDCPECGTSMGEQHSATCPWHGVYLIVSNTNTVLGTTADKRR